MKDGNIFALKLLQLLHYPLDFVPHKGYIEFAFGKFVAQKNSLINLKENILLSLMHIQDEVEIFSKRLGE